MHAHHYNRASERGSKPISNNIKRQVHDREGKERPRVIQYNKKRKKTNEQKMEYKI